MSADDGDVYRDAADELVKAAARLLVRSRLLTSAPPPDPATIATRTAQQLRDLADTVDLLTVTPTSASAVAIEVHTYAVHCAWLAADLHRAAVVLDPTAVIDALTNPEGR
ncbi:hypothetical protein [Amycolatopsis plumensis]|uniref:Uncharacterized protein n=1 Tax=Amycolatopsis plumensis TaxID=236508 RepID=A0ABV5UAM5_9PSEU